MPKLVPVAGYCRMSTDKQDMSIPRQKRLLKKFADEHGYSIVEWFEDEAKSGAKTVQRSGFVSMIKGIPHASWRHILVEHSNRFGRFDSLEAGQWLQPLQAFNVKLVSIKERTYDFNQEMDRVFFVINQDLSNHKFLTTLSFTVTAAMMENARNGKANGRPPYGYDRMLCNPDGKHVRILERGEKKPSGPIYKGYYVVYTISKNIEAVKTAKWVLSEYANTDATIMSIANELTRRAVPSPSGNRVWQTCSVASMLRNPTYCGIMAWNRNHRGAYHGIRANEIVSHREISSSYPDKIVASQSRESAPLYSNDKSDWIVAECEAMISVETWERIQRKLESSGRKVRARRNDYILSGLLVCGDCGSPITGWTPGRGNPVKSYRCRGGMSGICGERIVKEPWIVPIVKDKIREYILSETRIEKVRAELRRDIVNRIREAAPEVGSIKRHLARLDKQVEQAIDRLIEVPERFAEDVQKRIDKLKAEQDRLNARLNEINKMPAENMVDEYVGTIIGQMWEMHHWLSSSNHVSVREMCHRTIEKIRVWFSTVLHNDRVFYRPARMEITFRDVGIGDTLETRVIEFAVEPPKPFTRFGVKKLSTSV